MPILNYLPSIKFCFWIVFLAMWVSSSCQKSAEQPEGQEPVAVEAEIYTISLDSALTTKSYAATIQGKANVEIRPQVSGYIDRILVEEGAYVTAGKPLFQINAVAYQEQKNQALASLEAAKSQLIGAELELQKYQALTDQKVVTDFSYKKAKAAYESARALVKQQEALVAASTVQVGFTTIKAPMSGYLGRIHKRVGSLVSPADAEPMTTLSEVSKIYAYFALPEVEILRIDETVEGKTITDKLQSFTQVSLQLANGKLYAHKGHIDMMEGQFDTQTGAVTVRASFENPSHLLRSGNTAKVILPTLHENIFKIPVLATYELQDKLLVGKLDTENKVIHVELNNYSKFGDYYLVKEGFSAGDRIVAKELSSIPENTTVSAKSK